MEAGFEHRPQRYLLRDPEKHGVLRPARRSLAELLSPAAAAPHAGGARHAAAAANTTTAAAPLPGSPVARPYQPPRAAPVGTPRFSFLLRRRSFGASAGEGSEGSLAQYPATASSSSTPTSPATAPASPGGAGLPAGLAGAGGVNMGFGDLSGTSAPATPISRIAGTAPSATCVAEAGVAAVLPPPHGGWGAATPLPGMQAGVRGGTTGGAAAAATTATGDFPPIIRSVADAADPSGLQGGRASPAATTPRLWHAKAPAPAPAGDREGSYTSWLEDDPEGAAAAEAAQGVPDCTASGAGVWGYYGSPTTVSQPQSHPTAAATASAAAQPQLLSSGGGAIFQERVVARGDVVAASAADPGIDLSSVSLPHPAAAAAASAAAQPQLLSSGGGCGRGAMFQESAACRGAVAAPASAPPDPGSDLSSISLTTTRCTRRSWEEVCVVRSPSTIPSPTPSLTRVSSRVSAACRGSSPGGSSSDAAVSRVVEEGGGDTAGTPVYDTGVYSPHPGMRRRRGGGLPQLVPAAQQQQQQHQAQWGGGDSAALLVEPRDHHRVDTAAPGPVEVWHSRSTQQRQEEEEVEVVGSLQDTSASAAAWRSSAAASASSGGGGRGEVWHSRSTQQRQEEEEVEVAESLQDTSASAAAWRSSAAASASSGGGGRGAAWLAPHHAAGGGGGDGGWAPPPPPAPGNPESEPDPDPACSMGVSEVSDDSAFPQCLPGGSAAAASGGALAAAGGGGAAWPGCSASPLSEATCGGAAAARGMGGLGSAQPPHPPPAWGCAGAGGPGGPAGGRSSSSSSSAASRVSGGGGPPGVTAAFAMPTSPRSAVESRRGDAQRELLLGERLQDLGQGPSAGPHYASALAAAFEGLEGAAALWRQGVPAEDCLPHVRLSLELCSQVQQRVRGAAGAPGHPGVGWGVRGEGEAEEEVVVVEGEQGPVCVACRLPLLRRRQQGVLVEGGAASQRVEWYKPVVP